MPYRLKDFYRECLAAKAPRELKRLIAAGKLEEVLAEAEQRGVEWLDTAMNALRADPPLDMPKSGLAWASYMNHARDANLGIIRAQLAEEIEEELEDDEEDDLDESTPYPGEAATPPGRRSSEPDFHAIVNQALEDCLASSTGRTHAVRPQVNEDDPAIKAWRRILEMFALEPPENPPSDEPK